MTHTEKLIRIKELQDIADALEEKVEQAKKRQREAQGAVYAFCRKSCDGHYIHHADSRDDGQCDWCRCQF